MNSQERIDKLMDQVKSTERPNFTEAQLAIEEILADKRVAVLKDPFYLQKQVQHETELTQEKAAAVNTLRLVMIAKYTLPGLKF
jgi:hypothetical protein